MFNVKLILHKHFKGELQPSEAIYHKIHLKIQRLLKKKKKLATFYSFDEI